VTNGTDDGDPGGESVTRVAVRKLRLQRPMLTCETLEADDSDATQARNPKPSSGVFTRREGHPDEPEPAEASLYRAALRAAPDAYIVVDARTGEIQFANVRCETVLGRSPEDLVGRRLTGVGAGALGCYCAPDVAPPTVTPDGPGRSVVCRVDAPAAAVRYVEVSMAPADGALVVIVARDVTERVSRERRLRFEATHDQLTGLRNRAYLRRQIAALRQRGEGPVSAVILDVDGLKRINDTQGHAAGDRLLTRLAAVLRTGFRELDTVVRLGGDEFAVLLPDTGPAARDAAVRSFLDDLTRNNETFAGAPLSVSVGAATAAHPDGIRAAMKTADARMYAHKAAGR